jgi:hypothetical protein
MDHGSFAVIDLRFFVMEPVPQRRLIGIGAAVTRRPPPHHRAYGSVHGGSIGYESTVSPQGWAVLEPRHLDVMSESAVRFSEHYTQRGHAHLEDHRQRVAGRSPRELLQFPAALCSRWRRPSPRPVLPRMERYEGWLYFYFLGFVDPTDPETVARARLYAGLYMNKEPEAPNCDARLKIIRSPHTGSLGPVFGSEDKAATYNWSKGMASYGLPLADIPGVSHTDDLKNPENARKVGAAMEKRMYRGDVPTNLAATRPRGERLPIEAEAHHHAGRQPAEDRHLRYDPDRHRNAERLTAVREDLFHDALLAGSPESSGSSRREARVFAARLPDRRVQGGPPSASDPADWTRPPHPAPRS